MPRVFISHSTQDREAVERHIIAPLRARGVDTWYSKDDIRTATEWERQIHQGLRECDWFLVALSPRSVASEWVRRETHWAFIKRQDKILPVMLETCEPEDLHLGLLPLQFVDFRENSAKGLKQLLAVWGLDMSAQVDSRYRAAQDAIAKEDWAAAAERLQDVLRLDPAHPQAREDLDDARRQLELASLYEAGITHLREERWGEALEAFERLRAADSRYKNVDEFITSAVARLEREATRRAKTETREKELIEGADRQAHQAQSRVKAGSLPGGGDGPRDVAKAESAQGAETAKRTNKRSLGKALAISVGVIVLFTTALLVWLWFQTRPRAEDYHNRAETLRSQGKHDEAEGEYRKAVDFEPNNAEYHSDHGVALYYLNRHKEAEAEFRKAVELDPNHAKYHFNLGTTLTEQEKYAEAEVEYRKAVQLDPNDAKYYHNLGDALRNQNKHTEVEVAYRKAIELAPNDAWSHNNLGVALAAQKKNREAEAAYRKATELSPNDAVHHANLALILFRQNRPKEAAEENRKALQIDPNNEQAKQNLKRLSKGT